MIIVRVELHSARTGEVKEIGRMKISNDGTGTDALGSYYVSLLRRGTLDTVQRDGRVENHHRKADSVWWLVGKALKAVGFET